MSAFLPYTPYLLIMGALALASGFFSCSEAALFYLRREDREAMAAGGPGERAATGLLDDPDRLLTSILFWNLVINMAYFTLSALVTLKLEKAGAAQQASGMAIGALLAIIVVSEMLPKNLGVLKPRALASLLGLPLAVATRLLDPLLPLLQSASDVCERLVAPRFESEPYLELSDLERAITLGGQDPSLVEQEQAVLSRVVALSETRVEEVMRPRRQYLAFTPPVTAADLNGQATPSGYLLITEPNSEEIARALPLESAAMLPAGQRLDHASQPVLLAPWCATAASVLGELRQRGRRVAAVVNELGETIGIVTIEDLMAELLQPERVDRHPQDRAGRITPMENGAWLATGRTTLRRVGKRLQRRLPASRSITVAGMLQEQLQRMPAAGDTVAWGGMHWTVAAAPEANRLEVRVAATPATAEEADNQPSVAPRPRHDEDA